MIDLSLPGYKYLGPGSKPNQGEPVNEVDWIAYYHDMAYEKAKNKEEIFDADCWACKEFGNEFINFPSFAAAIGFVCIGVKNVVEKHLIGSLIYPDLSSNLSADADGKNNTTSIHSELIKAWHKHKATKGVHERDRQLRRFSESINQYCNDKYINNTVVETTQKSFSALYLINFFNVFNQNININDVNKR